MDLRFLLPPAGNSVILFHAQWLFKYPVKKEHIEAKMQDFVFFKTPLNVCVCFFSCILKTLTFYHCEISRFQCVSSHFTGSSSLSYNTPSHTDASPRLAAKEGTKVFLILLP